MSQCALPCCNKPATNKCSTCLTEFYCSGECQKKDWKLHKLICRSLKKLSFQLQPYSEVVRIIEEIRGGRPTITKLDIRLLCHLISYAKYQFGDRVSENYRTRANGERIQNWLVEVVILCDIYDDLHIAYESDVSLSMIGRHDLILPHNEKILHLLRPWSTYLDFNYVDVIRILSDLHKSTLLFNLSNAEGRIGEVYLHRKCFDLAELHCQNGLNYARKFEGEEELKIVLLCNAMRKLVEIRMSQEMFAKTCQEVTLANLKDPANGLDQQSDALADGYYNLGNVINQQNKISKEKGDLGKADFFSRESLRIRLHIYKRDDAYVGLSALLLGRILRARGKLGNETKEVLDLALHVDMTQFGSDATCTGICHIALGHYYQDLECAEEHQFIERRIEHLDQSKLKYMEALRIYTMALGINNLKTRQVISDLRVVTNKLLSLRAV